MKRHLDFILHGPIGRCVRAFTSNAKRPSGINAGSPSFATAPLPDVTPLKAAALIPSICQVPLSEPIVDICRASYANAAATSSHLTKVTTLENGLRIASEPKFGEFCTIGVLYDAGSRYECAFPSGVSHFIEKLAFYSSEKFPDRAAAHKLLEAFSGIIDCQTSRDTFIFASSCHVAGMDCVMDLLADASIRPNFNEKSLSDVRDIVRFDVEDMNRNPNPEQILMDWIHAAAYRQNTLGLPKFCPVENIDKINKDVLYRFIQQYFCPSRAVIAGVGVDHDDLVGAAKRYFVNKNESGTGHTSASTSLDSSVAQYTGGDVRIAKDLSDVALGPTPMPELAHFVIGLESSSYKDADFVAFCVLNSLMGGGGSFSAGGPGKGMYTRLYLNVLNRHHWMYNATSYNHCYSDSGIFCIHASSNPSDLTDLVGVILSELFQLTNSVEKEELQRAKTQLKSMLLMNLEQRPVMFEDIGRQVLGHGARKTAAEYMTEIDRITAADICRIGSRLLSSKAAVVGYGTLDKLPGYDKIDKAIAKRDLRFLKETKLFPIFK